MKSLLAIIFLAAVLIGAWWLFFKTEKTASEPKQESIKLDKHTPEFNQSISNVVSTYIVMKDAFVDADTFKVKDEGQKFITTVDSVKLSLIHI